jgi:hypothetical protein
MNYIEDRHIRNYNYYKKEIIEVAKTSPKIKFSLFEKGQAIAPDKWILKEDFVFYFDEIAFKKEVESFRRYQPYLPAKHYLIYSFSFIDTIKYKIWHFFYKIEQNKIEARKKRAKLREQQGKQLQILAKGMEIDIKRLIKEADKETAQAKELIERVEF